MIYEQISDPGIRDFLIAGDAFYPADAVNFTIAEQRAFYDLYCAHFRKPRPAGVTVDDFHVASIPCRRYLPKKKSTHAKLLYLHGGGFILGGLESHDDVCAEFCDRIGIETVAVAYRLAPEHPFPAAFDDCWAVLQTLGLEVVVAGDSAGGNLAVALSLKARDKNLPIIKGQVLFYPGIGGDILKGSYISQADAPGLSTDDVKYYRDIYAGQENKYASPLLETDYSNLPPAFLIAARHDPLHDDCFTYADHLRAAGVPAEVRDEPLLVHAFIRARHMSKPASESFAAAADAVRKFAGD